MAFESLADKLQNVFKNLTGKGRLSESDVKAGLKEVKMALLEADVSFKVVKQFISSVQERAIGTDVLNGLNPGQMVIKIVNDELVKLMGSEMTEIALKPGNEITVIMMAGLQGAGKTTTTAKIAGKLKAKGRNPLLAACDVYRPAAIEQLQKNGEKQGVPVFAMGTNHKPVNIAKAAVEHAAKNGNNVVIIDTAGRLHIDEAMMDELVEIKENVDVYQTLLVVDAMTGQDAVNVASMFNDKIGIDGVVLTKMDGYLKATSPSFNANLRCMTSAINVLPAPFGPITPHCCPSSIIQLRGSSKRSSGKRVTTFRIFTTIFLFSIAFLLHEAKVTEKGKLSQAPPSILYRYIVIYSFAN